ncbi:MAG: helix-turn-helix transcriptional regulator [Rhodospirillales bacterium]|nr:helix-turn-helix transcriptional regulator [Rhodospirillales bacterium]
MVKLFDMNCPVAKTLDVVGERWTLLILRDLFLFGPRRFKDFELSLNGIAPNTLSARIKVLEGQGIIVSRPYSDHPPRSEYALTDKGEALGPVLTALKEWGEIFG